MSGHDAAFTALAAPQNATATRPDPHVVQVLRNAQQTLQAQQQAHVFSLRAQRLVHAADLAAQGETPAPPPLPGEPKVTVNPDGRMTIVSPDGSATILYPDGRTTHVRPNGEVEQTGVPGGTDDGIPQSVQNVIEGFFFTIAFVAVGLPLARAFGRRMDRSGPKGRAVELSPELGERMDRLEHAVDSIAVEIERISEGQRFTTKLLTDRGDAAAIERQSPRKDAVGGLVR
jgi:hypothetical protein